MNNFKGWCSSREICPNKIGHGIRHEIHEGCAPQNIREPNDNMQSQRDFGVPKTYAVGEEPSDGLVDNVAREELTDDCVDDCTEHATCRSKIAHEELVKDILLNVPRQQVAVHHPQILKVDGGMIITTTTVQWIPDAERT